MNYADGLPSSHLRVWSLTFDGLKIESLIF